MKARRMLASKTWSCSAYDLAEVAKEIEPLLGADTMVMTVQNGIP
jgi:ketopantoate reductase